MDGYRSLANLVEVELEWEAARQDGFPFCAVRVWPVGVEPYQHAPTHDGRAYTGR